MPQALTTAAGRRFPAEWEAHAGTWISWPHNRRTWPRQLEAAEEAMALVVAHLAGQETVHINVLDAAHAAHVERLLGGRADPQFVEFHVVETNDAWIRDHGAIFVSDESAGLAAVTFRYNAWGGKYPPFDRDQQVATRMAEILGVARIESDIVLEGGSIEPNGDGLIMTTAQCLLNPNRNPQLDRQAIEEELAVTLGARQFIWLGDGLKGDDTDGHIDNLARFVAARRVVTCIESDPADANYAALQDNLRLLRETELADGGSLEVIELPMPGPVMSGSMRLPASYANYYVANDLVLVPAFDCKADETARSLLADCFPGRRAVSIDSRALVEGLGGMHCLTQQVPSVARRAGIS